MPTSHLDDAVIPPTIDLPPGTWLTPPVPAPPDSSLPSLEQMRAYRRNGLLGFPRQAYDDDVLIRPFFGRPSVMINAAEPIRHVLVDRPEAYGRTRAGIRILRPLIGEGLVLASGERWKRQRRAAAPAFARRATPRFAHCAAEALAAAYGRLAFDDGVEVNLLAWLQALALDVAGRAMFSLPLNGSLGTEIRRQIDGYGLRYGRPGYLDFILPLWLPSPRDIRRRLFQRRWFGIVDRLIGERRRQAPASDDLFGLLAGARRSDGRPLFDDDELRQQTATMLVAGHETTAFALFWALYLLALAPDWQERLAGDVAGVDLSPAGVAAALPSLPIARAIFDEALRLYPPAFLIVRQALVGDSLAGTEIGAGTIVMIAPWVLHRHRRLWRDPAVFDPGRFLPGGDAIDRFAYLPFGAGPRVCIGAPLALIEGTVVLASLIQRYRVALEGSRPVMPVAVVTTQPDHVPPFRFRRRDE